MKHYQVRRTFFSEFFKEALEVEIDLHILIQSTFIVSFSSNEAMRFQKNVDFKKILRNSSKVEKGIESSFQSLWTQRRTVHNYMKSMQKLRTSFVTQLYLIINSFQSLHWVLRCRVTSHLKLLKWQSKQQQTVYLTKI